MQQAPSFRSLEELETHFQSQIDKVDDPVEKAEIRVQMAEAKVALRRQEQEGRLVEAWKRLALTEYPAAAKFPELVTGTTEEEIRQSAKEVNDRVSSLADRTANAGDFDQLRQRAQDIYGRGGVLGGGSNSRSNYVPPDMAEERWSDDFARRFNEAPKDMYGVRTGLVPSEVNRYANHRFTRHVADRVRFWGQMTRSSGF